MVFVVFDHPPACGTLNMIIPDITKDITVSISVEDYLETLSDEQLIVLIQRCVCYISLPGTIGEIRNVINDSTFDD